MLLITNRFFRESIRTKKGRAVRFNLKNNAPSNSVFFCEQKDNGDLVELGNESFFNRLKNSPYRELLMFIHGFSNMPDDILRRANQMQLFFNKFEKNLVQVVPMIWPCDKDFGIIKDYWDDQKSADASAFSFSRVFEKFLNWREDKKHNPQDNPCMKRINVLAHSMGNRVLRETIRAWDKYDLSRGVPLLFRNTFLVAADVVNECLEFGKPGELICNASRNVVVCYAADDLALRASKISNLKNKIASRRLGHTGPEDINKVPKNVYAVDCDEFNKDYDLKGHTYFIDTRSEQPGILFDFICKCVKKGRVEIDNPEPRKLVLERQ